MINRNFKYYMFLFVFIVILAVVTGSQFFYNIAIFQCVLLGAIFLLLIKNKKDLFFFLHVRAKEISVGEQIQIDFDCRHLGILPVAFCTFDFIISNDYYEMVFPRDYATIRGGETVILKKDVDTKRRGMYTNGKINIKYSDPLHLLVNEFSYEQEVSLIIMPKVRELSYFYIPMAQHYGTHVIENNMFEDFSSIKNIREYQRGDSIKRVHWKLSSKLNQLHVKEFDLTANGVVNIFINCNSEDYDNDQDHYIEDMGIEASVSIIQYALKSKIDTSLTYDFDHQAISGKDISSFNRILKHLVTVTTRQKIDFVELIIRKAKKLATGEFICIITPVISPNLLQAVTRLKKQKYIISIIYLEGIQSNLDAIDLQRMKNSLKLNGIILYSLSNTSDITKELEAFQWEKQNILKN